MLSLVVDYWYISRPYQNQTISSLGKIVNASIKKSFELYEHYIKARENESNMLDQHLENAMTL